MCVFVYSNYLIVPVYCNEKMSIIKNGKKNKRRDMECREKKINKHNTFPLSNVEFTNNRGNEVVQHVFFVYKYHISHILPFKSANQLN